MTDECETALSIEDPDGFYARLIDAHRDLSEEESRRLNTRLILLLAARIGSADVLADTIAQARASLDDLDDAPA